MAAIKVSIRNNREEILDKWVPKTQLGKEVKSGKVTSISEIIKRGGRILEPEIIDALLPNLEVDLLEVGQSKGKFGGGKSSIWRQTQKVTREGNRMTFSTCAVIGNKDGYVGIGYGSAKETVPAREKAIRNAKLNLIMIVRGSGSWEDVTDEPHSIPFLTEGKCGSSRIRLMPAPRGTGLTCQKQCKKILEMAGIKDVYSKTFGQTTKLNLVKACVDALKNLSNMKLAKGINVVEGSVSEK
ncbi:30S ribosomal protein S5 [Candidatus Woesearchaeota archaeon]|nr:30S ribosomal protein S5 [Candidatus Woesearchaeota archaeon]